VEALCRGGPGGFESPARLFADAVAAGTVESLDEACLRAALQGVRHVGEPLTLFANIEPATLAALDARRLAEWGDLVATHVRVVLEVTERDLLERPAELMRSVQVVRGLGWGVALDDVGAHPAGLALVPFLRPDVIKLDLALVRERTTSQTAAVVNAVRAEAERSGAVIVAEGIETEQHRERALAMGARLGQGWMFGRPAPLAVRGTAAFPSPQRDAPPDVGTAGTPYELLSAASTPQRAAVPLLSSLTRQLEHQALLLDEQTVVLANFDSAESMSAQTRRRYESLAAVTALTAVSGAGMPDEPVPGVHGTAIAADDPLTGQWVVTVVSPHFAAALAARDVVGTGAAAPGTPAADRRLDYVLTYDRSRVLDAARLLLARTRPGVSGHPRPTAGSGPAASDVLRVPVPDLPGLLLRAIGTASNGITIADARRPDLPLVYVNEAFLRMTGYTEQEVLGRNCRFLQGLDTDRAHVQSIRRRLLAGRDVQSVLLNHRHDGTAFWNELRISAVRDERGDITHYIGHQLDVSARVDRERRTTYLAYHDELTSLPNRARVLEHLDLELHRARRSNTTVAAILLDLNGFKAINDELGHASGDAALTWAAHRLRSAVRSGDLLGRLGGDEFLVVLAGLPATGPRATTGDGALTAEEAVGLVRRHLHSALAEPLQLAERTVRLTASSGSAVFPRDAESPAGLIARADAAMYLDKTGD
jgi:diguanylate cyclase (GGDEF)-like protein/PAS domain S-box-containing protein